jgi:hypothetical protein
MARETDVIYRSPSIKHMKIFNFVCLLKYQQVQDGTTIIFVLEEISAIIYLFIIIIIIINFPVRISFLLFPDICQDPENIY